MSSLEDVGTDARCADGYAVVFNYKNNLTAVLATVPSKDISMKSLRKLSNVIHDLETSGKVTSFQIKPCRFGSMSTTPNTVELTFAVKNGDEVTITKVFEYMRQAHVLENPIVSDLRNFDLDAR